MTDLSSDLDGICHVYIDVTVPDVSMVMMYITTWLCNPCYSIIEPCPVVMRHALFCVYIDQYRRIQVCLFGHWHNICNCLMNNTDPPMCRTCAE